MKAGMRQHLPLLVAAGIIILFFAIFLLSKLRIHVEMR
jgi:hypothetical protein